MSPNCKQKLKKFIENMPTVCRNATLTLVSGASATLALLSVAGLITSLLSHFTSSVKPLSGSQNIMSAVGFVLGLLGLGFTLVIGVVLNNVDGIDTGTAGRSNNTSAREQASTGRLNNPSVREQAQEARPLSM